MKSLVVASTRPEVIKLAPVLWELERRGVEHVFATTGQHYDDIMFKRFIEELGLREPDHNVEVGSDTQAAQTARAMTGLEKLITEEEPDVVVVEGDTNSVLASALAAVKQKTPVAHVEAGLRSHDRTMPEEINRVLTDHSSEVLFAPTETAALNLVDEGITPGKIHVVGNTIVDAVKALSPKAVEPPEIPGGVPDGYLLLTLHRAENTDDLRRLKEIFTALAELEREILFPIHPRTQKIIKGTELERILTAPHIHVIPPVGYLDFLWLLKRAYAVLTDSGGVQEEAIILRTPCVTLRYNTERPETVWAGGNILAGAEKEEILGKTALLEDQSAYRRMKRAENPFGDGTAGRQIVTILLEKHRGGGLRVESSDQRDGFYTRRLIPVDKKIAGKMVKDSGYEIIKIVEDQKEFFPFPERILKEGQFIEILTRD